MKYEVFKKHVLLVSACCLISVASLSHSDKEVPLTQKSLQDIRKITIIVEQKNKAINAKIPKRIGCNILFFIIKFSFSY